MKLKFAWGIKQGVFKLTQDAEDREKNHSALTQQESITHVKYKTSIPDEQQGLLQAVVRAPNIISL